MPSHQNPTSVPDDRSRDTHFGFRDVPLEAKQRLVDDVFHRVADRYDLMNDLMSLGVHRAWKDAMVAMLRPPKHRPFRVIDVAGGTGDVAFRIAEAGGHRTHVTVCDINAEMLRVGRDRAAARGEAGLRVDFALGNAEELPFEDASFDAYTIAFGIRNVPRIEKALAEAFRMLRHGGRFLCLEFSHVDVPGFDKVYDAFSFGLIPRLGQLVANDEESYRYLVESIRRFPRPGVFSRMIADAGFARVSHRPFTGNIAAIHAAWKL